MEHRCRAFLPAVIEGLQPRMEVEVRGQLLGAFDDDVGARLAENLVTGRTAVSPSIPPRSMMITRLRLDKVAARALKTGDPRSVREPQAVMNSRLLIVIPSTSIHLATGTVCLAKCFASFGLFLQFFR